MQRIGENTIVANVDTEFPLDSIIEAHQYLEAGQANGKVMICVS